MAPPVAIPAKKPKLSKAERRALQEEQRAAKSQTQNAPAPRTKTQPKPKPPPPNPSAAVPEEPRAELFSHLPRYRDKSLDPRLSGVSPGAPKGRPLHPSVIALGAALADGSLRGANARCRAMMESFKDIVESRGDGGDFREELDAEVRASFQHFTWCRPHGITMGNAVREVKGAVQRIERGTPWAVAREDLMEEIDKYVGERIDFAGEVIAEHAATKVREGEVILLYGHAEVMDALFGCDGRECKIKVGFRVIVVDSRPLWEGRRTLKKLVEKGIECSYVSLNSLSYVMKEVTKVFLGAAALMSDGSILSRVGTAVVALMAKKSNIPVLVCCETYKITHRVQLESITCNELGDPREVANVNGKILHEGVGDLKMINLVYDLTPSKFVSGIVTEVGILPPSSVSVLLREMNVPGEQ